MDEYVMDPDEDPAFDLVEEPLDAFTELEEMANGWRPVNLPQWDGDPDEYPAVINEWGEYAPARTGDGTIEGQLVGYFKRMGLSEYGAQIAARGR